MQKTLFLPLLFFVLACEKAPVESNNLSPKLDDYSADSTAKWTRNVLPNYFPIMRGNYKDGKLSQEGC